MKLIINSAPLIPPLSGVGRYTQCLTQALIESHQLDDIRAFSTLSSYSFNELKAILDGLQKDITQSNSKIAYLKHLVKKIPLSRMLSHHLQQKLFNKNFSQLHNYIYWETNYILQDYKNAKVTTVYDLSHVRYPEFHPKDRQQWLNSSLQKSLDAADSIITISKFSQQEIMDVYGICEGKISIIPPAVSNDFRTPLSQEQLLTLSKAYQLPEQFILSVGNLEPRKNLTGLINAYEQLPISVQNHFPLVIVGNKAWLSNDIEKKLYQLERKGLLIWLGFVAQKDLPGLYQLATLFMYVSLYEGYGMPVAEAMCSGTPVITSNLSSMPEVSSNCTELVNPHNIDQISVKIGELLENSTLRTKLVQQAIIRSQSYTWDKSADKLLHLFNSLQ